MSRWRLVAYTRLVSSQNWNVSSRLVKVSVSSRALTSCAHPWLRVSQANQAPIIPWARFQPKQAFLSHQFSASSPKTLVWSVWRGDAHRNRRNQTELRECNVLKRCWKCLSSQSSDFTEEIYAVNPKESAEWPSFCTFQQWQRRSNLLRSIWCGFHQCFKAWRHEPDICWSQSEDQWRLLT